MKLIIKSLGAVEISFLCLFVIGTIIIKSIEIANQ